MFSIFKKNNKNIEVKACVSGNVIPIEEVNDQVFSTKAMGDGVGIEPTCELVTAPCDAEISVVMEDSKHAIGLTLENGAEILIHLGLDTVYMNGEGLELLVKKGQKIQAGDPLLKFNKQLIEEKGYDSICIVVLTNQAKFPNAQIYSQMLGKQNETIIMKF